MAGEIKKRKGGKKSAKAKNENEMQKSDDPEVILTQLVPAIEARLGRLNNEYQDALIVGLKTAYVETLEMIQMWKKAASVGLDYKIEEKFPIDKIEKDPIDFRKSFVPNWPFLDLNDLDENK